MEKQEFRIIVASPPDYNNLVAEIYLGDLFFAMITQERGKGTFDIETPGAEEIQHQIARKSEVNGFIEAIREACSRLT